MKRFVFPLALALGAPLAAAELSVVSGWLQVPAGQSLGQVSGVGANTRGDVFIFHRGVRPWMTDPAQAGAIREPAVWRVEGRTGRVLAQWGAQTFLLPHGLFVDHRGHLWLTDVGRHQVFEYTEDGKLLRTWGEEKVAGHDPAHFDKPTDVAVLADGAFYVSDGYGNSRVAKFGADGKFQFEWGRKGKGRGEFDIPHGITVDPAGRVYVADRQNDRIQVFTPEGHYITEWKNPAFGRPYGVRIGRDQRLYVADGGEQPKEPPHRSKICVLTLQGEVVATLGRWGSAEGEFQMAHDLALAPDGSIYVGEINGQRVQKLQWKSERAP